MQIAPARVHWKGAPCSKMKASSKSPSVVVVGSSNTDLVLRCARLPLPGETVTGGEYGRFAGGKGANQAVAAARAGARVSFVGVHGDDDFGREAKRALRSEGVDVRFFREEAGVSSGLALILVGGRSKQNMIAVAKSANDRLSVEDIRRASKIFGRAVAIVCQLETPIESVMAAARQAAECGVPFILNPAPASKLPRKLLACVHTLTPNEHEVELLTGLRSPALAAAALRAAGCRNVVVTLGARGVLVCSGEGNLRIDAARVKPVDTVGAGDCFTAWLAAGIAEGMSLPAAAARAVKAASLSVTRRGAQDGMPRRGEVS